MHKIAAINPYRFITLIYSSISTVQRLLKKKLESLISVSKNSIELNFHVSTCLRCIDINENKMSIEW